MVLNIGSDVDVFFTTAAFVSGQVLNNLDSKGIYGVLVELTGASCGGSCGTTTTDLNGDFIFTGLSAGSYTLLQTNLPGYNSVSDSDPPNDDQINLTLPAGSNSTGHLFTDTPGACAAPVVVSTESGNGVSGISLSTSTLTVTFDQPMITYGGGSVLDKGNFDNNIDNQTLGGDVPIVGVSYDPNTYTATLTIDTSDKDWLPGSQFRLRIKDGLKNACDVKMAAQVDVFFTTDLVISGQVRNDLDGDGDLNDLDSGITGVTVELSNGVCVLGSTCPSADTTSGGFFIFNAVTPGNYTLVETDPPGYFSTNDSAGGNDNQIPLTLVAGTNSIGHRFLDSPILATISGQVRFDVDGDGNLNDPDPGLAGILLQLSDGICTLGVDCPTAYTNTAGSYVFNAVPNGTYVIYETDPQNFVSTRESDGGNNNQIAVTISGSSSTGNNFLDTIGNTFVPACAPLTTTGLAPTDDSFIDENNRNNNYGNSATLRVNGDNDDNQRERSLLKFDLTGIPSNATVTSAYLYIYANDQDSSSRHRIYRVTTDWLEGTVTWNSPWTSSGGDFNSTIRYNYFTPNNDDCLFTLNLTYLVQLWVDNTYPNYGLMIWPDNNEEGSIQYNSKEHGTVNRRPRLVVNYTVP